METDGCRRERIYVDVETFFDRTGHMNPMAIYWKDGRRFDIQAVRDFRPAYKAGNDINGDCFTIVINGQERYLFSERRDSALLSSSYIRWFVEKPFRERIDEENAKNYG